jgi:hypothetical protein
MKTITYIVSLIALAMQPYFANAQAKISASQTEAIIPSQKPISRTEVAVKNMPGNSDAYILFEKKDADLTKVRIQSLPITYGIASIGAAIQHVNNGTASEEIGGVVRLAGKLYDVNVKIDTRYFPPSKILDWYGFLSKDKMFGDILGAANLNQGKENVWIRPGLDYKISDNISTGLEAKITAKLNQLTKDWTLKTDYIGARLKYSP